MPIFDIVNVADTTTIYLWKITEDLDFFLNGLELRKESRVRLEGMKSVSHKKGFLSIRHLLDCAGYKDEDLFYDLDGKPYLKDGKKISITHSFEFSAIIISTVNVGIDIEQQRDKIERIAQKFSNDIELKYLSHDNVARVRMLTVIWGAKEAMYKMCNSRSLSFKDHMRVAPFSLDNNQGLSEVVTESFNKAFVFYFLEFEGFTMVYALENE